MEASVSLRCLLGAALLVCGSVAQDFGGALCPDGRPQVNCLVNPCIRPCDAFPLARCEPDYCGGCSARYYVAAGDAGEVEVMCTVGTVAPPQETEAPGTRQPPAPLPSRGPPADGDCPDGCRGEKGHKGGPGWFGARGPRGLPGSPGKHGNYLIYTDGYILPSGVQVSSSQSKQAAGGKVTTASEFGPEAMGDKGQRGPPGPQGLPGSPGLPGSIGRPGTSGAIGDKGEVGELGLKGLQGQLGWPGPQGLRGDRGPTGQTGRQGPDGRTGDAGDQGDHGARGVPGIPGPDGREGPEGDKGTQGIVGDTGRVGVSGDRGVPGIQGLDGEVGGQGQKGERGFAGSKGGTGPRGFNGVAGTQGVSGAQGTAGEYGPDVKEVSLQEASPCTGINNGKVQYDFVSDKLYFCNGREWRCVDHVDCHFNCHVSDWEPWQPCSQTCGRGMQIRHRTVLSAAGPYGNPCPTLNATRSCPNTPCECRTPPNIANGQLAPAQISYAVGETAQWVCNTGHDFVSGSSALCQEGGRFTTLPRCQPVRCPDPGRPANGQRFESSLALFYQGTLTYSCNEGYTLLGTRVLQCRADSSWSAARPSCVPADCRDPGTPANGAKDLSTTHYGSTASFTCHGGYQLTGESTLLCRANGQWSDPLPSCMPISCSNPGTPEHGSVTASGANFEYESNARFSCDEGYALIGSAVRQCAENGEWTGSQPVCNARSCPRVSAPLNGEITTFAVSYSIASRISFACNHGFTLQGDRSILCQDGGAWTAPAPVCERTRCCHLSDPSNGRLSSTGREFGDVASVTCEAGFRREGSEQRTCQVSGNAQVASWSGRPMRCVPIRCPDPEAPLNGGRAPAFAFFTAGDSVAYTCNLGYQMTGPSSRMCQDDGTWDQALPSCHEILCDDPGTPDNGMRTGDSLRAFTDLTFSCHANYRLNGPSVRTCQIDGSYTGVQPTCDPDCVVSAYSRWSDCSVTCGTGTELRTRRITQFPAGAGLPCPVISESRDCTRRPCALCYDRYGANETAHVAPNTPSYAADILVVVEQTQPMAGAITDLAEFLVTMELELLKQNTGTDPALPNRYTVVGFGRRAQTGEECGHFIVPQSAGPGVTTFTADEAAEGLEQATADSPSQITDGYEAMLFAVENAELRHSPNVAHNLIFMSGSSRATGCGAKTVSKEDLRRALVDNGVTPNFIIDHRIRAGNDKPEEVLGVRSLAPGSGSDKLAYVRQRNSAYREQLITAATGVDYTRVEGTIATDYTDLTFDLAGMMWNLNTFRGLFPGSTLRGSFSSAFTETKAKEMNEDARDCKLCTCEDNGAGGLFRCKQQYDQEYCRCRASGRQASECAAAAP
ncbi:uncharacterized protein LOC135808547 [Sycon ciliatum]|uniref:uncharacterized protein LOC135808547 n=1 Tax=Sycon ciliatum TaxID=27933 RepID=UPI0031F66A4F